MTAPSSIADLEAVIQAPKRLEGSLAWRPQHIGKEPVLRNARVKLVASLVSNGVVLEGVQFIAAASVFEPDRMVAMQLAVRHGNRMRPFARIDWRGAPHTNRKNPASRLWMKSLGETHVHRLADNAFLGWPEIVESSEDLPEADATPPLGDFRALLAYVADEFGVDNADQIREPPWEAWLIRN